MVVANKPKYEMLKVEVRMLRIHPIAQRKLVQANVKRIYDNLDLDAIGVIHAVRYPIKGATALWVVDGQSRVVALTRHEFGEWKVDVKVHLDVQDDRAACKLFKLLNTRSAVAAYDYYLACFHAGETDICEIEKILRKFHLRSSRQKGDGQVAAVGCLVRAYRLDEGQSLSKALGLIAEAWGTKMAALDGKLLEGLALLISKYSGKLEIPALTNTMSKYRGGPGNLTGVAKNLKEYNQISMPRAIARAVIDAYNLHRKAGKLDPI